ncbi:MAG TPA: prolyl oligopeptidase family serine peptidase [Gemmatimonadaceae bacterium]|nr:prolyl oligopeptidase family serine peptidase [Gemmatimonadaceae bacterium]
MRLIVGSSYRWLIAAAFVGASAASAQGLTYPTASTDATVDTLFGTAVPAPYRWMEDLNAPGIHSWVTSENALTADYLSKIAGRDVLKQRLTALWNFPKVSLPRREVHGQVWFYQKNSGLQRQAVLYVRRGASGAPSVLIDPNQLSPDGSISLAEWSPSPDGRYVAYGLSEGGSDWRDVHVREVATGHDLSDTVSWVKFSGLVWTQDGGGFYYSRFPAPSAAEKLSASLTNQTLYYHKVGTPQSADIKIFALPAKPTWFVNCEISEDGRFLIVATSPGAEPRNTTALAALGDPMHPKVDAPIVPISDAADGLYTVIDVIGSTEYILTDKNAPKRRVIAVDLAHPDPSQWRTIVPEGEHEIEDAVITGGRLTLLELVDVKSTLRMVSLTGAPLGTIALPGIGSVLGLSSRADSPELLYSFQSPLYPETVFRYDIKTGERHPFDPPTLPFDVSQYQTQEVFYTSKDGTKVPMFITAKKGLKLDGSHPTMLYAYGGFDINLVPTFSPTIPLWLELGGVYATANLRGGAEYGEAWHHAGMREKKQNVFDDFIAAAEYLEREKYSSPAKMVIQGGSNGGLLVGAVEEQRPDLYAVALPAVGVMDMLRYDRFTGGAAWTGEYGSATDSTAFRYLIKYSPVQNIRAGVCYPATFVTTADHDDRVVPSHSYKFTAAMQAVQHCDHPVLIHVETEGSHGYLPTDKRIANTADLIAFTAANLGLTLPSSGVTQ